MTANHWLLALTSQKSGKREIAEGEILPLACRYVEGSFEAVGGQVGR